MNAGSREEALVPFGELVMFVPADKPQNKGEVRNRVGTMLGLVDRSDEVVIGTTERAVKARTVHRMPAGQRGDAAYAKSIRSVRRQPNPAEVVEGEPLGVAHTRNVSVPMVPTERRPAVPVMEPREHKARRFYIWREVQPAKYGFSDDSEGCRVAQSGAEAKLHGEGCRERIKQAVMNDDVGQQRLRAAEQRIAPAGQQAVATRDEAAQEGQGEEMTEAPAASSARSVGRLTVEKARIGRGGSARRPESHASWRVADGHQRDGSDLHVTGCGTAEFQSGRIFSAEKDLVTQPSAWASRAAS